MVVICTLGQNDKGQGCGSLAWWGVRMGDTIRHEFLDLVIELESRVFISLPSVENEALSTKAPKSGEWPGIT